MNRNHYDMTISPLKEKGEVKTPVYIDKLDRPLSYINGIMMTTVMNKGTMLKYFLDKTNQKYDEIIFVDDSKKNVVNM